MFWGWFNCAYRVHDDLRSVQDHLGELLRSGRDLLDFVSDESAGGGVNKVENVIERRAQRMDIFPVERGNERPVQLLHQGVGKLIALVLQEFDFRNLLFDLLVVLEQGHQHRGSFVNVFRLFVKEAVKLLITGYQLHKLSSTRPFEQGIVNEMLQKRKPVARFL